MRSIRKGRKGSPRPRWRVVDASSGVTMKYGQDPREGGFQLPDLIGSGSGRENQQERTFKKNRRSARSRDRFYLLEGPLGRT